VNPHTPFKATALLVEDESLVRTTARVYLEELGVEVLEAQDAEQALSLCQQRDRSIDLLVSDVLMPKMIGPKLAEVLSSRYPGLKVLYISGHTRDVLENTPVSSHA